MGAMFTPEERRAVREELSEFCTTLADSIDREWRGLMGDTFGYPITEQERLEPGTDDDGPIIFAIEIKGTGTIFVTITTRVWGE